jgi:hypothetical protein
MVLQRLPISEVLALYARVVEELRRRGVTRSSNNPFTDYAEYLCESFSLPEKVCRSLDVLEPFKVLADAKASEMPLRKAAKTYSGQRPLLRLARGTSLIICMNMLHDAFR